MCWIVHLRFIFPEEWLLAFNKLFTGVFSDILERIKEKLKNEDTRTVQTKPEENKDNRDTNSGGANERIGIASNDF